MVSREIVVHRRAYTRKDGTHVKATTYREKDRGKKGKGKKTFEIKKGKLAPYHVDLPARKRHEILEKKIRKYGALSVFRSLNAQVVLRKDQRSRDAVKARKVFEADKEWVKRKYGLGKRR